MEDRILTTQIKETKEDFSNFLFQLEGLAEKLSEPEFDDFLKDNILPALVNKETAYRVPLWTLLEAGYINHFTSILEERNLSLESAIGKINVTALCWILDHIYIIREVLAKVEKGSNLFYSLKRDLEQLQDWVNGDVYERIQNYEAEIKKLQGAKA